MRGDHLFTTEAGVSHSLVDNNDGTLTINSVQEVDDILDHNQRLYNHNDGYTVTRDMKRVASIPMSLLFLWKTVEGWDPFHPANQDRLTKKLNDGDYLKLRTLSGRV
ncbi:MAG: hypothetical protein ACYDD1_04955 [Caulobacteraceae bacterium]